MKMKVFDFVSYCSLSTNGEEVLFEEKILKALILLLFEVMEFCIETMIKHKWLTENVRP